ncbi:retropepsin-like aspartic protease family protein [Mangrovimicrobium sediminis]|nr:TIGR02281 family clan AA aspartic protease [Haliea sp. SAOS-164]
MNSSLHSAPKRNGLRVLALVAACLLASLAAAGPRVVVQGLLPGAAIISVDGERKLMRAGDEFRGVRLHAATPEVADVEVEGERMQLRLSQVVGTAYAEPELQSVVIRRDNALQYQTRAAINGRDVMVLVDTGANLVAMNEADARHLGVDLANAEPTQVETASGMARAWRVSLRSVDVGGIVVHNVEAGVMEGRFPVTILLGMTYLRHVKMEEKQGVMTLFRTQ